MTDNGCLTPECKKDNYKCPHWNEHSDDFGGECALPKSAAVTQCPYLRRKLLDKCKRGGNKE